MQIAASTFSACEKKGRNKKRTPDSNNVPSTCSHTDASFLSHIPHMHVCIFKPNGSAIMLGHTQSHQNQRPLGQGHADGRDEEWQVTPRSIFWADRACERGIRCSCIPTAPCEHHTHTHTHCVLLLLNATIHHLFRRRVTCHPFSEEWTALQRWAVTVYGSSLEVKWKHPSQL